jgi:RNA-binding protein
MPSSKRRRSLRAHGHPLSALVHVGKGGLSPVVIKQVEQTLHDHELVKVKVDTDRPDDRFGVAELLAARPGVNIVQIVGHVILNYKRHPREPRF